MTLAGRVLGTRTDTVGEVMYVYPLLACLEVHLWRPRLILAYCIPMTTGGAPIPSVASERFCGSSSALKEQLCGGTS
jgi:hypothetical protein